MACWILVGSCINTGNKITIFLANLLASVMDYDGVFFSIATWKALAEYYSTMKNGLENVKFSRPLVSLHFSKPEFGTESRNRTGTESPQPDFESGASTSSAIPAKKAYYKYTL